MGNLEIGAVCHTDGPVDASSAFKRVIVDSRRRQTAVGNNDSLVVRSVDNRVEYLYFLDRTGVTLGFDEVAYLIWLQQQYKYASGKILKRAAERHTYCYAGRCEQCQKRARLYAEQSDYRYYQDEIQCDAYQTQDKGGK